MAQGDFAFFNEFLEDEGLKIHNLNTDTLKLALTDGTTTPTAATANPRWGAGGTTNFAAEEVAPVGGNYVTGGTDITNTYSESAGTGTLDGADVTWSSNASNPTNARWGILYNDTSTGKEAVGFLDLGSTFDMTTGDLVVTWNASGIGTKTAS